MRESRPPPPGDTDKEIFLSNDLEPETKVGIAVLNNANVLMPHGIVWDDNTSEIFIDTTEHGNLHGSKRFFVSHLTDWKIYKAPFIEESIFVDESICYLYTPLVNNIFHALHDSAFKYWIMLIYGQRLNDRITNFFFCKNGMWRHADELAAILGIPQRGDVGKWGVYRFRELVIPYAYTDYKGLKVNKSYCRRLFRPEYYAWLREKMHKHLKKVDGIPTHGHRLALLREDARHRRIDNIQEVKKLLEKEQYSFFSPGNFTLGEQMYAFRGASNIFGIHGASLLNTVWCEDCEMLTEVLHPLHIDPGYRSIAAACGMEYRYMLGQDVPSTKTAPYRDVRIDTRLLAEMLTD
jgi:hypothetical protein